MNSDKPNHCGKKSSKRRVLKFKFHPITIKSRAKSQKISWRRVQLHSTVPVTTTRENEMRKEKEIFGQKNLSCYQNFLGYLDYFGIRRLADDDFLYLHT